MSELRKRWADQRADHPPSAVAVVTAGFIEHHDKQTVLLESGVFDQRVDVGLQPAVGGAEATIVGIIAAVRGDERVVWQVASSQIGSEMREGHQLLLLRRAVLHVSEISNGDMPNVVLSSTAGSIPTEVADRRQALGISFPGLPRSHQFAHYVVRRNREAR